MGWWRSFCSPDVSRSRFVIRDGYGNGKGTGFQLTRGWVIPYRGGFGNIVRGLREAEMVKDKDLQRRITDGYDTFPEEEMALFIHYISRSLIRSEPVMWLEL